MAPNAIAAITRAGPTTKAVLMGDEETRHPRDVLKETRSLRHCSKHSPRTGFASGTKQGPCSSPSHRLPLDCELCEIDEKSSLSSHHTTTRPAGQQLEPKQAARPFGPRRPAVEFDSFLPLDVVQEESSCITDESATNNKPRPATVGTQESQSEHHSGLRDTSCNYVLQIQKHLAGRYDWVASYPPWGHSPSGCDGCDEQIEGKVEGRVYGCNVLGERRELGLPAGGEYDDPFSANRYILLATPLDPDAPSPAVMEPKIVEDDGFSAWEHSPTRSPIPLKRMSLRVPDIIEAVENALLSPSLTFASDRSCSYGERSSRTGSFSLSRIEDSLEELDRLEDELEALVEVTNPRRMLLLDDKSRGTAAESASSPRNSKLIKRASTASLASASRAESPSRRVSTLLRQSSSASLRRHEAPRLDAHSPKAMGQRSREGREPASPKHQAEVRKGSASPSSRMATMTSMAKTRASKPSAHATFELPGEAISRRKREQHEAKLRAEEEEERRRREFKARPMKRSTTPSMVPRETIASRARQAKIREETAEKRAAEANKAKRLQCGKVNSSGGGGGGGTSPVRGRSAVTHPMDRASRATSASMDGNGAKRSSVVYGRDNAVERRDRERRERELVAKTAREAAADRSRMASREWAEKKRRQGAAVKQAVRF